MKDFDTIFAPIIGRILMGAFFLWSGIEKVLNLPAMITIFVTAHAPAPTVLVLCIITIEVMGGLALIVGQGTKLVALGLAFYVLISGTMLFSATSTAQLQLFLQDMAIVGGLLLVSTLATSVRSRAR